MAKNLPKEKDPEKNNKPTEKKTKFSKLDKGTERKPPFKDLLPPEEESPSIESSKQSSPPGSTENGGVTSLELQEICGNLWVVLYQLGGVLKKGFEPITENTKKLLAPPTARCAVKYDVQSYMKDEFLILGILGVDISRRLLKKDDGNNRGKKEKGKDDPGKKPDSRP